jgi:hypothetical protein
MEQHTGDITNEKAEIKRTRNRSKANLKSRVNARISGGFPPCSSRRFGWKKCDLGSSLNDAAGTIFDDTVSNSLHMVRNDIRLNIMTLEDSRAEHQHFRL